MKPLPLLLDEIQTAAASVNADVPSLLRRCENLNSHLKNAEFGLWVNRELDGYPPEIDVPDYRVADFTYHGNFLGPFGNQYPLLPIKICHTKPERRSDAEKIFRGGFRHPVSTVVERAKKPGPFNFKECRINAYFNVKDAPFSENLSCVEAFQSVDKAFFSNVLDAIKTSVNRFCLKIGDSDIASLLESGQKITSTKTTQITNIFNTTIMGNNTGNIAQNSRDFLQAATTVQSDDMELLKKYLLGKSVSESDVNDFEKAVKADGGKWGDKVKRWSDGLAADVVKSSILQLVQQAWKFFGP